MSPDSSEDSAIPTETETNVKREKIMYTSPHKLKAREDPLPDCANFMNGPSACENPFVGQVDGRLNRTSSDDYSAIAENFNLYDSPDDSLSDNNVTSSNHVVAETSKDVGSRPKSKDVATTSFKSHSKKQVTVVEEVSTSNDSKPRSPVSVVNGAIKGILKPKPRELTIKLYKYTEEEIKQAVEMDEISKPFPKFSFMVCDFRSEKEKIVVEKSNASTNYANFNDWREPNGVNEHREQGKIFIVLIFRCSGGLSEEVRTVLLIIKI